MTTAAQKWLDEQQRMKEAADRWPNKDDDRRSWPILVTETIEHVIWVEGETHDEALEAASQETHELTSSSTCSSADMNVEKPDSSWDWERVYENSYHSYQGIKCNAHEETRREWLWELDRRHQQATADNEDLDGISAEQRKTCAVCRVWRTAGHEESFAHQLEVRSAQRRAQEAVAA